MNRLGVVLSRQYSRISTPLQTPFVNPIILSQQPTSSVVPSLPPAQVPHSDVFNIKRLRLILPSVSNESKVYTFPSLTPSPMIAPSISNGIIGRVNESMIGDMRMPSYSPPTAVYAAPRLLTIRRKKMKKHKRRKRYDRDWSKYQKYHREKKLKAEREYEKRMKGHLAELEAFNAEQYVRHTIAASKQKWERELAPTGRKLYPHWSRLMTLEELYGLPKSDYIDKKSGIPNEEDTAKINLLKEKYKKEFKKEN